MNNLSSVRHAEFVLQLMIFLMGLCDSARMTSRRHLVMAFLLLTLISAVCRKPRSFRRLLSPGIRSLRALSMRPTLTNADALPLHESGRYVGRYSLGEVTGRRHGSISNRIDPSYFATNFIEYANCTGSEFTLTLGTCDGTRDGYDSRVTLGGIGQHGFILPVRQSEVATTTSNKPDFCSRREANCCRPMPSESMAGTRLVGSTKNRAAWRCGRSLS
jgi:hypothetical protein